MSYKNIDIDNFIDSINSDKSLSILREEKVVPGNFDFVKKNLWWILILILCIIIIVVILFSNSKRSKEKVSQEKEEEEENIKTEEEEVVENVEEEAPVVKELTVLNSIRKGQEPNSVDHVIYFTLQDDASLYRFYKSGKVIGQGSLEDLDIRYAPPFRRVKFTEQDADLNLPFKITVESYDKNGVLIGSGDLMMNKSSYHDKP